MTKRDIFGRREFLKIVGAGAAATGLAACAPAVRPAGQAAAPAAAGATPIQFWDMVWGPPEYIDTCKKLVDKYNTENPSVKVTYQSTPWSSWPQVFTTAIGSGTAPDVSTGGGFQPVQFYDNGAILPVDDLAKTVSKDDFAAGTLDANSWDGHTLAIPWNLDIRVPFYRKDLLEAAKVSVPANWDDLHAVLKATTKDKQYGIGFAGNSPLGWQQMISFAYNNGGGLFTEDGKLDVLNDRNVEAFSFIASLIKDGLVHPGSAGFNDNDLTKAWSESTIAMTTWGFGFEKRAPDLIPKTAVLPPMKGPHGDMGTQVWINSIMMYKQSKNPDIASKFLNWWSTNALPIWTEGHCGVLPARKSIASNAYFQDDAFAKPILNDWVPLGRTLGAKKGGTAPLLGKIDGSGVMNTLATDILQGMEAKAALQKASDELSKIK